MMKYFRFLRLLNLLIACSSLFNVYSLKGEDIEYGALYLVTNLGEESESVKTVFPKQKLISIKRIVSDKYKHAVPNAYNSHENAYYNMVSKYSSDFSWEYDGITWYLDSFKKKLSCLACKNTKHVFVETDKQKIKITKRLFLSTIANIQYGMYAYYFEIEYEKNNESKVMRLLCMVKGYEYVNSYTMKLATDGEQNQNGDEKNNPNIKLKHHENEEVNLMKLLVKIGQKNQSNDYLSLLFSHFNADKNLFRLPISFQWNTYTKRRNEEELTNDLLYTVHFDREAKMTCYEYESRTMTKNEQWKASVAPVLLPADYAIFVIRDQKFYPPEEFKLKYPNNWGNSILDIDKIKEMITYTNANQYVNKYRKQDISLERNLGEDPCASEPRFGVNSVKTVKVNKGTFKRFQYKHRICEFVREEEESVKFHYFNFFEDCKKLTTIAIPKKLLEGPNRVQFEKEDSTTAEWVTCSDVANQQYTLMLIDSLIVSKGKQKNLMYFFRDGDQTPIYIDNFKEHLTMYHSFWKGLFRITEPIRIKFKTRESDNKDQGSMTSYYIKGGAGVIALFMFIMYGPQKQSEDGQFE